MKNTIILILQISTVFIGTIVGAGLASGQEITQFFATYGYKSFMGIIFCFWVYVLIGFLIISISIKYKLNSYNEIIKLVSPGFLGKVTDIITTIFLISTAGIILAGSGSLINQYFGISKWIGIFIMLIFSIITLFKDTKGLIKINSFIVPSLIMVILTIFILYLIFCDNINMTYIKNVPYYKTNWIISALTYSGFNILCCTGVLVPLSSEIKNKKILTSGVILGSLGLTILAIIINTMLLLNIPYIFKYEIPLLYVCNRFGKVIQIILLFIIYLEMFSTEVSNIYSVSKTLKQTLNISYKKATILIAIIAVPISQIGFVKLITFLYPGFGIISFIFIIQCIIFYFKNYNTIK